MNATRRNFICGGLACACASHMSNAWAQQAEEDEEIVVCTTDESALLGAFEVADFAADSGFEIKTGQEDFRITDYGTIALRQRWQWKDGLKTKANIITLGCFFMSGSQDQRNKVQQAAKGWLQGGIEKLIEFDFSVPKEHSQIRILIGASASNSVVGRGALSPYYKNKTTLNLSRLTSGTIQHEFGHALGLLHEHLNPAARLDLDEDAIIKDMEKQPTPWDEPKTRLNIIDGDGSQRQCLASPNFDAKSIMMYDFPKTWTKNRKGFRRASMISKNDYKCVLGLYSK